MTFLILSDIHGSTACLETAIASFESKVDAIILLGDYLNHGHGTRFLKAGTPNAPRSF